MATNPSPGYHAQPDAADLARGVAPALSSIEGLIDDSLSVAGTDDDGDLVVRCLLDSLRSC